MSVLRHAAGRGDACWREEALQAHEQFTVLQHLRNSFFADQAGAAHVGQAEATSLNLRA